MRTSYVNRRVQEILSAFSAPDATAPWLLCDRHPGDATAFTVASTDHLSTHAVSFAELAEQSRRVARALQLHGIAAGDRVATLMGRGPELPAIILGIWRLGAVYVPLFTAFAAWTVADRIEAARAKAVVTDEWQTPKVTGLGCPILLAGRSARHDDPTDVDGSHAFDLSAWIAAGDAVSHESPGLGPSTPLVHMFTSGTTGKPKASCIHSTTRPAGRRTWNSVSALRRTMFLVRRRPRVGVRALHGNRRSDGVRHPRTMPRSSAEFVRCAWPRITR
jgi:acetyl-CoA synthetase